MGQYRTTAETLHQVSDAHVLAMRGHLRHCEDCQQLAREWVDMAAMPEPPPPPEGAYLCTSVDGKVYFE
jgi:hypothetical protein